MTPTTTTFPPLPQSVPLARRFIRGALEALNASGAIEDAETLISEMATNAVLHAHTEFTIDVTRDGPTVRIQVRDLSAVLPRRRDYAIDATTGRGVRLLESLSSRWGVDRDSAGKTVWFDLPAAGNPQRVPAWDEDLDVDVDALLASFDDPGEPGHIDSPVALLAAA